MAQVSIRFAAPGTRNYTVGNDVVGGVMKMEAIGAGGAGGTATVNSGGGGKGGAYARRNAQAVVAGQTLTVTVAPSVAAAAGTASSVSVAAGQVTFGAPATTGTQSGPVRGGAICFKIEQSDAVPVQFIGSSGNSPTVDNLQYPAGIQVGDLLIFLIVDQSNPAMPNGAVLLASFGGESPPASNVYYKIATSNDIGATYTNPQTTSQNTSSIVAYRNANIPLNVQTIAVSNGTNTTVNFPAVPGGAANGLAFYAIVSVSGTAETSPAPPTMPSGTTVRVSIGQRGSGINAGVDSFQAISDKPLIQSSSTATTYVQAAGGNVGGNGSATAGGTGATAQNGTSIGDVTFTGGNGANGTLTAGGRGGGGAGDSSNTTGAGPNTQFGVSGGTGGLSAAAGQVYGGGGGGATTLAARGAGASGIVVLTYSTGTGTIGHSAVFNRRITAFRRVVASITHSAVFNRLVTIRRMFTASVTHVSRALKTIKLRKTASVTHLAAYTRKALRLRKTASIVHTPFIRRALRVLRTASIVHTPVFKRLVTLRRRFVASVQHRARMLVKLEARLIPREGGGGTVTNVFRNLFLFDE